MCAKMYLEACNKALIDFCTVYSKSFVKACNGRLVLDASCLQVLYLAEKLRHRKQATGRMARRDLRAERQHHITPAPPPFP